MKKLQFLRPLLIAAIFIASIAILIYPFISNYMQEHKAEDVIESYDIVAAKEDHSGAIARARQFNEALREGNVTLQDPFSENVSGVSEEEYESILRVDGTDVMGYINIPAIQVKLPIYHGTDADVLEKGVGHLKGSSLPVGGEGTHAVLTGHTGLSSAKLFTDLTQLKEGDYFFITVYDQKLCYQVDQIKVVIPSDVEDLAIEDGQDYCTLVTCTPYGINSHRLLVRGVRCAYTEEVELAAEAAQAEVKDSEWLKQYKLALVISLGSMAVLVAVAIIVQNVSRKKKKKKRMARRNSNEKDR